MPGVSIVGSTKRVVDAGTFSIDELAGNVATNSDRISIAYVKAAAGTSEPWLTLDYDEWMCVLKGKVKFEVSDSDPIFACAGSTVFVERGTRFKPSFEEDSEYVPVCLPAFRPDRCKREDTTDDGEAIASKLQKLHSGGYGEAAVCRASGDDSKPEVLYHMTTKTEWEAAKAEGVYYPKSYEKDGHYTHATGVPSRLITTLNHFYQDVPGDWICLVFTRSALRKCGIHVRDEEAMPVGDKPVGKDWGAWICPHVIGGLPTHIVTQEYPISRDTSRTPQFIAIEGLDTTK
jgi:uncharacterized protein (DUF952 family)/quercetin dioxygenase-like cupin family protein